MTTPPPTPLDFTDDPSMGALFEQLVEQTTALVRAEVALAKAQAVRKAKHLGIAVGMMCGAALIVAYALGVLMWAAILGLGVAWPLWLSALVFGVFYLAVAAGIVTAAIAVLKKKSSQPSTGQRLKADADAIRESLKREREQS